MLYIYKEEVFFNYYIKIDTFCDIFILIASFLFIKDIKTRLMLLNKRILWKYLFI